MNEVKKDVDGREKMEESKGNEMPSTTEVASENIEATSTKNQPEKTVLRRFNPPTLERKDSSGDLQSRLKTRKMLGVGETDNGDIHRSKISQVLGHNEHLYVRMPKGYWTWYLLLLTCLLIQSLLIFWSPEFAILIGILPSNESENSGRFYAVSLIGFVYMLKNFFYLNDKTVQRVVQGCLTIIFAFQISIDLMENLIFAGFQPKPTSTDSASAPSSSSASTGVILLVNVLRAGLCNGCVYYWKRIGSATSGLRRSPSHKEVDDLNK